MAAAQIRIGMAAKVTRVENGSYNSRHRTAKPCETIE
jgi:hypothetical protein